MEARQFFDLVRRMRAYQRAYFKNKRKSDLQQSKILESQVDEEIKRVDASPLAGCVNVIINRLMQGTFIEANL